MAVKQTRKDSGPKPRNDAYTGLLAISFLAMAGSSVLLYLDYSTYGDTKPPSVNVSAPGKGDRTPPPVPKMDTPPPKQPDMPPDGEPKMDAPKDADTPKDAPKNDTRLPKVGPVPVRVAAPSAEPATRPVVFTLPEPQRSTKPAAALSLDEPPVMTTGFKLPPM